MTPPLARWYLDNLPMLGMAVGIVTVVAMITRTGDAVARAARMAELTHELVVHDFAEELADAGVAAADEEVREIRRGDLVGRVRRVPTFAGSRLAIDIDCPGRRPAEFRCVVLDGAAPRAFALALGVAGELPRDRDWIDTVGGVRMLRADEFPRLDHAVVERRPGADRVACFSIDPSIGLRRLRLGTDLPDYRIGVGAQRRVQLAASDGVLFVPGHLWLDRDVELVMDHAITVVVAGNVYVCGDIAVSGPGRLTVFAHSPDPVTGVDRDGDGYLDPAAGSRPRWMEGAGAVYLGSPGSDRRARVTVDGAVVADGSLYVDAAQAEITGALVVRGPILRTNPRARLRLPASRRIDVHRQSVPGFEVSGGPRAGRLSTR